MARGQLFTEVKEGRTGGLEMKPAEDAVTFGFVLKWTCGHFYSGSFENLVLKGPFTKTCMFPLVCSAILDSFSASHPVLEVSAF